MDCDKILPPAARLYSWHSSYPIRYTMSLQDQFRGYRHPFVFGVHYLGGIGGTLRQSLDAPEYLRLKHTISFRCPQNGRRNSVYRDEEDAMISVRLNSSQNWPCVSALQNCDGSRIGGNIIRTRTLGQSGLRKFCSGYGGSAHRLRMQISDSVKNKYISAYII